MKYLVVIEKAKRGFSAYLPDLPGCVAAATTRRGVERAMKRAIAFHMDGLRADGMKVPEARTSSAYVVIR